MQVFKDNATYTLTEKFDSKQAAAVAFDKMAVALGRGAPFLNNPSNFTKYLNERNHQLDLLCLSYLTEKGHAELVKDMIQDGFGQSEANDAIPPAGSLRTCVEKGRTKNTTRPSRAKKIKIVSTINNTINNTKRAQLDFKSKGIKSMKGNKSKGKGKKSNSQNLVYNEARMQQLHAQQVSTLLS